ncbi:DUF190 domain-containing protein [Sulfurovum sp. NBC37-1]|uniref:DUF190 domain-containing protein n=1 Tax=Sulfurovum sp. (strain NBC37-1) TaxID=387093 RepID=UPI0001587BE8|nr:DUF190 domain-containing protein [Sulfurovum sp. NBC37-1]BAF72233.1 conserved hypothetical protein [Sulfurovum sp. NBC37-1]
MQRYLGIRKELKIYISNEDTVDGKPLFEALLTLAKEKGLAGATVLKAVAGMGAHSEIHSFNVWALKQKVPLIVTIIDTEEKIKAFLDAADGMIAEGLVTMNDIEIIQYHHPKFGDK